jgi:hypothetical protein
LRWRCRLRSCLCAPARAHACACGRAHVRVCPARVGPREHFALPQRGRRTSAQARVLTRACTRAHTHTCTHRCPQDMRVKSLSIEGTPVDMDSDTPAVRTSKQSDGVKVRAATEFCVRAHGAAGCVHSHAHMYTQTHTHTHTHTHTRKYTHTCTCVSTHSRTMRGQG